MARDYLAAPASSTDSERTFSQAKLFGTDRRTKLCASNLEAMLVLHSAFSNDLLSVEGMNALRADHSHMKGDLFTAPDDAEDSD